MATTIQIRRDTAANWTANNPILAEGEFGYETDTKKKKIGDGVTTWSLLDYEVSGGGGGANGLSAYQVAVASGYVGTEVQWLASLKGADGATGPQGATGDQGIQGVAGTNGLDGAQGIQGNQGVKGDTGAKGDKGDAGSVTVNGIDLVDYAKKSEVDSINTYINGDEVFEIFNNNINLNTVNDNPSSLFGYNNYINDVITLSKIIVKPRGTSVVISVANKDTGVIILSNEYSGLIDGQVQSVNVNLTVNMKLSRIFVSNYSYTLDGNSPYTFSNESGNTTFQGYLSYYFEYKENLLASILDISTINDKISLPSKQSGAKVGTYLDWKNGDLTTSLFSTTDFIQVSNGISLNIDAWNRFKNGRLSNQEHTISLQVNDDSKIQFKNGDTSFGGFLIDFTLLKITDTQLGSSFNADIPLGFLTSGINHISIRYTTGYTSSKVSLFNERTSELIELNLSTNNEISQPGLSIKSFNSNDVILKNYNCSYPYNDIDVVFMGDSITQGLLTTAQYAMLFKEYTGLNVATAAVGGAHLYTGVENCLDICKFRPKVVCAMFGANGGNTVYEFLEMQNECDKYNITFLVHQMPNIINTSLYNEQNAIIQSFIEDYAHVKQSARFDIATSINGNITNGTDLTKFNPDGVHPNDYGHLSMFNRLLIDCPILFNLF